MRTLLTLLAGTMSMAGSAQWSIDPADPMLVAPGTGGTAEMEAISDGADGYYAFWRDKRADGTNYDVYGQRFDAAGNALWTPDGALLFHQDSATTYEFSAMRSEAGHIFLATIAGSGTFTQDLKVMKLDADGTMLWDSAVTVTSTGNPVLGLSELAMTPTSDGAILGWYDIYFGGSSGVNVARVTNDGDLPWAGDGYAIPYATYGPFDLLPDGADGVMVNWREGNGLGAGFQCMRVDSSGANAWNANVITNAGAPGFGGSHMVTSGPDASLLLVYADAQGKLRLAGLDTSGNVVLDASTAVVCPYASDQASPHMVRQGNQITVVWTDNRPPASNRDLYMQRLSLTGELQLDTNGVQVIHTNTYIPTAGLVASLNGGVIGTIDGSVDGYSAMRMNADGTPAWTAPTAFCTPANNPFYEEQVQLADGTGGVVSFWRTSTGNIHGARIYANGDLGDHTGMAEGVHGPAALQVFPVPATGPFTVVVQEGETPRSVQAMDAAGRRVTLAFQCHGDRVLVDPAPLADGVHTLRVVTAEGVRSGRVLVAH
ncbi:MAG: hypothetical protein IT228_07475 [Flavobacteriales bacterium]|nr:hypothetical protein [Flavobacteriales bacterium]NUQ15006.1 hypothetical protein [Flavobacteriales bacterium]